MSVVGTAKAGPDSAGGSRAILKGGHDVLEGTWGVSILSKRFDVSVCGKMRSVKQTRNALLIKGARYEALLN